jgi:hypothetical protein
MFYQILALRLSKWRSFVGGDEPIGLLQPDRLVNGSIGSKPRLCVGDDLHDRSL